MILPAIMAALGGWLLWREAEWADNWLGWLGALLLALATAILVGLLGQLRQPRIAYKQGEVLFYVRPGAVAVPVQVVEAFFVGQGPAMLTDRAAHLGAAANLVARLSQRQPQWHQRDVKPALGQWSDGYVTIRGMWCEPITGDVIRRLNRRLREVSEQEASSARAEPHTTT